MIMPEMKPNLEMTKCNALGYTVNAVLDAVFLALDANIPLFVVTSVLNRHTNLGIVPC